MVALMNAPKVRDPSIAQCVGFRPWTRVDNGIVAVAPEYFLLFVKSVGNSWPGLTTILQHPEP